MTTTFEYDYIPVFCGSGGQSLGFKQAEVRLLGNVGRFKCRIGIDFDPVACEDFERFVEAPALCMDVMAMYHFWSSSMFKAALGPKAPWAVLISAPCKGMSRLLSAKKARQKEYRQLNRLAVVWLDMMLEAWGDSPPALVLFENVPGITSRGKAMLRSIRSLLRSAGYVFHSRTHDCGELGGLAQNRERFLLVARHPKKCAPLLYEPPKKRVRGVGEVLSKLPMPATKAAAEWGDLHTMPRLAWRNWLRLGLIPAGGDWRNLEEVLKGRARREVFRRHAVQDWKQPIPSVTGDGGHAVGAVADPRVSPPEKEWNRGAYGVKGWDEAAGTVTGGDHPSKGPRAVADVRIASAQRGSYGVDGWTDPASTITGEIGPSNGTRAVADPRVAMPPSEARHWNKLHIDRWEDPALTVIGKEGPANGGPSVADPRVDPKTLIPNKDPYDAGYGVLGWSDPARAVAGTAVVGAGAYAVADPRSLGFVEGVRMMTIDEAMELDLDPNKPPLFIPVIVAEDGTWHRPLTRLELAALQSYPVRFADGSPVKFSGTKTQVSEHIGNSIPPDAAKEIGNVMLVASVQSSTDTWSLSGGGPVWVGPVETFEEPWTVEAVT